MYVAWRDLRFAKGRFALMGTVVVLITLLVGLLSGLTVGLGRENISAITDLSADYLAFSAPADGRKLSFADSSVSQDQWKQWARAPGVTHAEPLGITTTRVTAGTHTAALSVFGVEPGSTLSAEAARVNPGTVVLSHKAADQLGARPGQVLNLGEATLRVSAVTGDASFSHTPVVWIGLADWQRVSPGARPGEHATVIALTTDRGAGLSTTDRLVGTHTVSRDAALRAIGAYTSENGSLQLMRGFLFAISALVIGAFFTVWTIQRTGDVAVLKALGASTGYLLKDALGQAVVLLTAGTALGAILAAGLGALVAGTVPFVLDVATILYPAVVMIVLGGVGAALSIRRITAVDPLNALGSAR